jgi:hypothetical protein
MRCWKEGQGGRKDSYREDWDAIKVDQPRAAMPFSTAIDCQP